MRITEVMEMAQYVNETLDKVRAIREYITELIEIPSIWENYKPPKESDIVEMLLSLAKDKIEKCNLILRAISDICGIDDEELKDKVDTEERLLYEMKNSIGLTIDKHEEIEGRVDAFLDRYYYN